MKRLAFFVCLLIVSVFKTVAQDSPDNQKTLLLYESQRFSEAASYLESFYTENTRDSKLLNSLAYSNRMSRNYQKADFYYSKLYEMDTTNFTALANLAFINNQRGRYKVAADLYQQMIEIDSMYVDGYTALASLAIRNSETIPAYIYLQTANYLQPTNSIIANDLAEICLVLEKLDTADSVLTIALHHDPQNGALLYTKAKVSSEQKKYPEVVETAKKLIELGEDTQQVWALLGKAYFQLKNYQAAFDTYSEALPNYTNWGEIDYYYIAMTCKALKRFDEAHEFIEKALKVAISPNTGFYFAQKAGILKDLNKPSIAATTYIRSFQYQDEPIDYFNLAVLYDHDLSNKANALKYYRLYINKKPGSKEKTYVDYAESRINDLK